MCDHPGDRLVPITALQGLNRLQDLFTPAPSLYTSFAIELSAAIMKLLRLIPALMSTLPSVPVLRTFQLAEYRADALAVEVGGTQGTAEYLDLLLCAQTWQGVSDRAAAGVPGFDPLATFAQRVAVVTKRELRRRSRMQELSKLWVDTTHPSAQRRHAYVQALPVGFAKVTARSMEMATIDTELARFRSAALAAIRFGYPHEDGVKPD